MFCFTKVAPKVNLPYKKSGTRSSLKEKCQQSLLSNLQSTSYQQMHNTRINHSAGTQTSAITLSSRALSFFTPDSERSDYILIKWSYNWFRCSDIASLGLKGTISTEEILSCGWKNNKKQDVNGCAEAWGEGRRGLMGVTRKAGRSHIKLHANLVGATILHFNLCETFSSSCNIKWQFDYRATQTSDLKCNFTAFLAEGSVLKRHCLLLKAN